ncbi:MAG TPA: hypothetical protein VF234_02230 [Limnochordia bacterium]
MGSGLLRLTIAALVGCHLGIVAYVLAARNGGIDSEWLTRFSQAFFIATILCHATDRLLERPASQARRLLFVGFFIYALRDYMVGYAPPVADLMSLTTVWCVLRSQGPVLNPAPVVRRLSDVVYAVSFALLVGLALGETGGAGFAADWPDSMAYALAFSTAHLVLMGLIVGLYAQAAIASFDPLLRARLIGLVIAAVCYIWVFVGDFVIRISYGGLPEAGGVLVQTIKHVLTSLGLASFYLSLSMGPRLEGFILRQYQRWSLAEAHRSVVSLAVFLSESIAERTNHILPTYAVAVGEALGLSPAELEHLREAATVVALIHRHELPPWESDCAWGAVRTDRPAPDALGSAYHARLQALIAIERIVREQAVPYHVKGRATSVAASIIRVVRDYLVQGDLERLRHGAGRDYAPEVVAVLTALLARWGGEELAPAAADGANAHPS